jgi:two-component system, response regulator
MAPAPEILLIEDNADDRDLFAAALRASGISATVTFAQDAAQAVMRLNRIGIYAETPLPALVVLDLGLPGLQGTTLLQVIRNAYGPRSIPVVVLTGSYRIADRTACEAWGISEYLIKPNSYAGQIRLVSSLRRWLQPAAEAAGSPGRQQPGAGSRTFARHDLDEQVP